MYLIWDPSLNLGFLIDAIYIKWSDLKLKTYIYKCNSYIIVVPHDLRSVIGALEYIIHVVYLA